MDAFFSPEFKFNQWHDMTQIDCVWNIFFGSICRMYPAHFVWQVYARHSGFRIDGKNHNFNIKEIRPHLTSDIWYIFIIFQWHFIVVILKLCCLFVSVRFKPRSHFHAHKTYYLGFVWCKHSGINNLTLFGYILHLTDS